MNTIANIKDLVDAFSASGLYISQAATRGLVTVDKGNKYTVSAKNGTITNRVAATITKLAAEDCTPEQLKLLKLHTDRYNAGWGMQNAYGVKLASLIPTEPEVQAEPEVATEAPEPVNRVARSNGRRAHQAV